MWSRKGVTATKDTLGRAERTWRKGEENCKNPDSTEHTSQTYSFPDHSSRLQSLHYFLFSMTWLQKYQPTSPQTSLWMDKPIRYQKVMLKVVKVCLHKWVKAFTTHAILYNGVDSFILLLHAAQCYGLTARRDVMQLNGVCVSFKCLTSIRSNLWSLAMLR